MIIKDMFVDKAIIYGNIQMYFISTAKELINACKKYNIIINSLDAFKLTGDGIQPSQDHSISFVIKGKCWDDALEFLSNISDKTYLYEIWYEGY